MPKCECTCDSCENCIQKNQVEVIYEDVAITLWFPSSSQSTAIYKTMLSNYEKIDSLLYQDIPARFERYKSEVYQDLLDKYGSPEDVDFHDVQSEAYDLMHEDFLMRYQFHFSQLVNLYHVFEQQIRKELYRELNHRLSPVRTKAVMKEFATQFGDIRKVLKLLKFPLGSNNAWSVIMELNKIANTYKHGDGQSAGRLQDEFFINEANQFLAFTDDGTKEALNKFISSLSEEDRKEYEERQKTRVLVREMTTNLAITLQEEATPYRKYIDGIIQFWESVPEHVHSVVKVEIDPDPEATVTSSSETI